MSLGRSSRFASLALLRKNLRTCCPPLHLHRPSPFIMVVSCVARILDTDIGKTLMNMEMLKFWRARASKIIPCVVFNKVVHIIHPSLGVPFLCTPPNDRCELPQAGIKSFNDLRIKGNSFCHLRGYFYESPSLRCPIMVSWQFNSSLR